MATILIIDDLEDQLNLLATYVATGMPDHSSIQALGGADGLAAAERELPDLIIADVRMPGLDGYSLCRSLKVNPATRHIPILLISGWVDGAAEKAKAYASGADGFLPKPCEREELVALAETLLSRKLELDGLRDSGAKLEQRLQESQSSLRESEEMFEALFRQSPDAIFLEDENGTILDVNEVACRLHNATREELVGTNVVDLVPESIRERVQRDFHQWFDGEAHRIESSSLRNGTTSIPVELSGRRISYHGKHVLLVHARDISERVEAQTSLQKSEDRYRRFFEEDMSADFIADGDGLIMAMNPSFARMFGLAENTGETPVSFVDLLPQPEMWPDLAEKLKDSGSLLHHNLKLIREDGSEVYAMGNLIADVSGDGEINELSGYLIDVTEHRQVEQQLRQSQKMESLGRLAGGIAHDFNNLLTSILGFSNMLMDDLVGDEQARSDLQEVVKAGERAAKLTQQLLAFGRKQAVDIRALDLNTVVHDMDAMLRRTLGQDIEFVTMLHEELGAVLADGGLVEQVIMNLIVNSRDAMPEGGKIQLITQETYLSRDYCLDHPGLTPGHYALLKVSDTGTGIPPDILPNLFEPFFTTKAIGKGTGLGLATVYGIVKQCRGHVDVTTRLNQGTTFFIYFPLSEAPAEQMRISPQQEVPRGTETILLVEDESSLRMLAARMLKQLGYKVYQAGLGTEAIRLFERHGSEIDLLLTDVVMPHMGGPELADHLQDQQPELRVLFASGFTQDALATRGLARGGDSLLVKPFGREALAQAVRSVLDTCPDPNSAGRMDITSGLPLQDAMYPVICE